jgi:hypothetical protein
MARFVALLLVLCTLGVIVADAQCGVWCSVSQCNSNHPETGCHHHRQPSSQQCLHQHNLTQTLMRTTSSTAIPLQVAGLASLEFPASAVDETRRIVMLVTPGEQPPGLLTQTALRI